MKLTSKLNFDRKSERQRLLDFGLFVVVFFSFGCTALPYMLIISHLKQHCYFYFSSSNTRNDGPNKKKQQKKLLPKMGEKNLLSKSFVSSKMYLQTAMRKKKLK